MLQVAQNGNFKLLLEEVHKTPGCGFPRPPTASSRHKPLLTLAALTSSLIITVRDICHPAIAPTSPPLHQGSSSRYFFMIGCGK
ncbi:unnamed protein product [Nezara viridula]|uniref:Uncharacterized protein n=1 Tax=Nezara viridula TaxID=85310 RepID=A0A9P0HJG6_NEZVI|nr:unnamed protein product [Nezara viridula]